MKKIYIAFAAMLTLGLASCDMDKYPQTSIEESQYMKTYQDFADARTGLYPNLRALTTGSALVLSDIQCDDFQALAGFSNTYGDTYRWEFQPSSGDMGGIYAAYYSEIKNCNYFIDNYLDLKAGLIEGLELTDAQMAAIDAYAGEAYFIRAYCYFMLTNYFCKAYNPATADKDMGMPLQLVYNETPADNSKYPGRASMKMTYAQIESDLNKATDLVDESKAVNTSAGKQTVHYVTKNAVKALRARVALYKCDYQTAYTLAAGLVNGNKYPLYNSDDGGTAFINMWINDTTQETIWQIFQSKDEQGATTGTTFLGQYNEAGLSSQKMDFVPSGSLMSLFTQNDIRFYAYFDPDESEKITITVSTGATGAIYLFRKYSGNPALSKSQADKYLNMSHPLRIAEQYLIAAEAAYRLNDETNANKFLKDLRVARIGGYAEGDFSGTQLFEEIQKEYRRELVGEGHRLFCMKRWGLDLNRNSDSQDPNLVQSPGSAQTTGLSRPASDFRFVWPIPKNEIDMSPALAGQQNPGY